MKIDGQQVPLDDLKRIIREEIRHSVRDTMDDYMQGLGIDVTDKIRVQKDMAWVHKRRKEEDQDGAWFKKAVRASLVPGLLLAIWEGVKNILRQGI